MEATGDVLAQEVHEVILSEATNGLELRGAVCGPVVQTLFHQARRLERHSAAAVRCDRLTSLDASALQVLLALHRTLQEHGHVLELRAVPPGVLGQLRAVGAADLLCISTDPIVEPESVIELDLEAATPTLPIARGPDPVVVESPNETVGSLEETVESPDESAEASAAESSTPSEDPDEGAGVATSAEANESVDDAWSLVPANREPPEET